MLHFKAIKKLRARITAWQTSSRKAGNKFTSATSDPCTNNKNREPLDNVTSKSSKKAIERRVIDNDRRRNTDTNYKGPSRRFTIDRRFN